MKEITKIQHYWHYQKYNVMMRQYKDYLYIKSLIKNDIRYQELVDEIEHLLNKPIDHSSFINTFQHLWGYFKKEATSTEKAHYIHFLSNLENGSTDYLSCLHFIQQLTRNYHNHYLYHSAIMDY